MKTIIRNISFVAFGLMLLGSTGCVAEVLADVFFFVGPFLL